jgi:hypothetical protein
MVTIVAIGVAIASVVLMRREKKRQSDMQMAAAANE